ncbi:hypothetical protein QAD02_010707 [Eretmocerus hayati]|uniref:Uncharacterized protein n=1 Tax=Eretmocerus hayati TaxID=131215 RepID=A0ACC2NWE1_9HYME|nr:hypothetical protein QAD02_010707 [Eretmocerus hayati]
MVFRISLYLRQQLKNEILNRNLNEEYTFIFSDEITSVLRQKRTINGKIVQDRAYPCIVSLDNKRSGNVCGGIMISRRLVLTAAHCIEQVDYVRVFEYATSRRQKYEVSQMIVHPSFLPDSKSYQDIGLIVLSKPVKDAHVIQLPPKNLDVPTGANASAFGWGTIEDGSVSKDLRKVDLPITYAGSCTIEDQFNAHWICTESKQSDICDGDSGGPLLWNTYVVGIASMVLGECRTGVPSIFTKVAAYRDWIDKYISEYQ